MATTTRVLTASVNGTVYTTNANGALEAIDTCHSGATAPTDEVANGKFWLDTTTTPGILKMYNNAAWEVINSGNVGIDDNATSVAITIDASENVGIGTVAPTVPLTVSGAAVVGSSTTQLIGSAFTAWSDTGAVAAFRSNEAGTGRALYIDIDNATGVIDYDASGAASGIHAFSTAGIERMRIDSSGNVGIGTATPADILQVKANNPKVYITCADTGQANLYLGGATTPTKALIRYSDNADIMYFHTNSAEAMRIDSSGNVLVGTTTPIVVSSTTVAGFTTAGGITQLANTAASCLRLQRLSNDGSIQTFFRGTTSVGSISVTASATAYNTSSDYRLKENITPIQGAGDIIKAMQPCTYTFKSDGSWHDGFLAHELQELHPRAVIGSKDAMKDEEYEATPAVEATYDAEGVELTPAVPAVMGTRNVPDYQGVDYSKLTPILTAALKEALDKIDALEARIAALEV